MAVHRMPRLCPRSSKQEHLSAPHQDPLSLKTSNQGAAFAHRAHMPPTAHPSKWPSSSPAMHLAAVLCIGLHHPLRAAPMTMDIEI